MCIRKTLRVLILAAFVFEYSFCIASTQSRKHTPSNQPTDTAISQSKDSDFYIEPTPKWVLPAPATSGEQVARTPMHYALLDEQDQVDSNGVTAYNRFIRVVNNENGLSSAAETLISFDPSYQKLIFHHVEISRNGVSVNKLDRSKVKILQREKNLEEKMYDGMITASIVLDDIRVGDQVDISYSIQGMNPAFEGKYLRTVWMTAFKGSTLVSRFRLIAPENRHISYKLGSGTTVKESLHDGLRDSEFMRVSIPQAHADQFTPASTFLDDQLNLSEFSDWSAVASWGERLFSSASVVSPLVKRTIKSIGITAETVPLERLRLALNFVQQDIRYFGTEIGENSHLPASPDTVINQRFGDCKDKVSLLISLLNALGIHATPVLVSTQLKGDIAPSFATPLVFDHVIARVEVEGKTYWLDGTRAQQSGTIVQRQSIGLGKGLVLQQGILKLEDLPETDTEERIAIEESYRVPALSDDPILELKMTYFGEMAELLRAAIASQPIASIEAQLNSNFIRFHPNATKVTPLRIEEISNDNAIRVIQNFKLPEFWQFPDQAKLVGNYFLWNFIDPLRHTDEASRQQAFQIRYPGIYRHTIAIEFSEDVAKSESNKEFHDEDHHLYVQTNLDVEPRKFLIRSELHLLKDKVTAAEWSAYNDFLRKLLPNLEGTFSVPAVSDSQLPKLKYAINSEIESWKGFFVKNKPVTNVQADSRIKILRLNAELESNRLPPKLKAQALRERGVLLDQTDRVDLASKDFELALKLLPNDPSVLADAAINYFEMGQNNLALEYAKKTLEASPSNSSANRTIANVYYFEEDYISAKKSLLTLLKNRSEINDGYAAIFLYFAAKRNDENATEVVKPYLAGNQSVWPYPLLQFITGSGTFDHALAVAQEERKDPSKLCELYFYAGEKYLIDGQINQAKELFQKSVDTGVTEYVEFSMSKRRLRQMNASR